MSINRRPRILFWDIETTPIVAYTWGLFDQNIGLNMIKEDWTVLCWAAKWRGETEILYAGVEDQKDRRNDKKILKKLWNLLDEADIVVTQNGKKFDQKKVNARFAYHKLGKPSKYQHIDTLQLAKKHFAFTSNKLEFMTGYLVPVAKKDSHKDFPGFELWKECLAGNPKAWKAMRTYNERDVIALENLFDVLEPWGTGIDFSVYDPHATPMCNCGNTHLQRRGYNYTNYGQYQRYQCMKCRSWLTSKKNLLTKDKRSSLLKKE